jgi:ATP-dependent helicase/DNAse subunit B
VPLTLITGPANAGKAELVFEGLREDLARGGAPWLIVPRAADARHYRRELAGDAVALGVRVALFDDLSEEMARRALVGGCVIDAPAREQVIAALLAKSRGGGVERGYARELARLVGELERTRVTPARLRKALGAWERSQPGMAAGLRVLGEVYGRYGRAMRDAGLMDLDARNADALDALRKSPALWRAEGVPETAVFFYGFDDLTTVELDAIETLACLVDAPVTVALTYEGGRVAFTDRAGSFQVLMPWATRHLEVPPASRHYAPAARRALAHLERRLFEPDGGHGERGDGGRVDPAEAITVLEGGGERAELELVAAEVRALLDGGVRPREIALVHRTPEALATTLPEVLRAHGVPFSLRRRAELVQSALGRGLLGLMRCALLEGDARDLLAWLRTPGVVRRAELVDRLEVRVALSGARTAAQARALWEEDRWPLDALDRVRGEVERGAGALVACVERELWRLFCAPRRGAARELGEHERDEASAFRAASATLASLRELIERLPQVALLEDPAELIRVLEEVTFTAGGAADEDAVAVLRPHELRARRVRALFLCGLQERVFPAPAKAPTFLGEQERRGLAEASGLVLEAPRDGLARERYLLYSCVSRPEELLVLSWHTADDDGEPTSCSLFVDDVCDLFDERLLEERRRRSLGAIDRSAIVGEDPCAIDERADARLHDERVLEALGSEHVWSASALGAYASCPVRWFVEHLLRPEGLEPESEPLASGRLIHEVLAEVMETLRREHGSARLDGSRLERARQIAAEAIERSCAQSPLSLLPEQSAGLRRRLEADIDRFLEHAAQEESSLEPAHLELAFGLGEADPGAGEDDARVLPALDLGGGVRVRGRIDRIDIGPDAEAVVYDYKRRGGASAPAAGKWMTRRSLQVALYMRAARDLLGVRAVGGFYQPVTGEDLRARGALAEGVQAPCMKGDRYEPAELEALVDEVVALARESASLAAAGALEARPHTCSPSGRGCMYPTICRCSP